MRGLFLIMSFSGALLVTACGSDGHRESLKKKADQSKDQSKASADKINEAIKDDSQCLRIDLLLNEINKLGEQKVLVHAFTKNLGHMNLPLAKTAKLTFDPVGEPADVARAFFTKDERTLVWAVAASDLGPGILPGMLLNKSVITECNTVAFENDKDVQFTVKGAQPGYLLLQQVGAASNVIEYRYAGDGRLFVSHYGAPISVCGTAPMHTQRTYVVDFATPDDSIQLAASFGESIKLVLGTETPKDFSVGKADDKGHLSEFTDVNFSTLFLMQQAMNKPSFAGPECAKK